MRGKNKVHTIIVIGLDEKKIHFQYKIVKDQETFLQTSILILLDTL